jgi:hypothetical protein
MLKHAKPYGPTRSQELPDAALHQDGDTPPSWTARCWNMIGDVQADRSRV